MRIEKTIYAPNGVTLPYKIIVENPKGTVGIFGDSFAQLAEFKETDPTHFTHERSWVYFLANILNLNCDTYGLSKAGMGDIFYTLMNCNTDYDYYIVFNTNPKRKNHFTNVEFSLKNCKKIKDLLKDKDAYFIYWDKFHNIFNFDKPVMYSKFHITNKNIPDECLYEGSINPLDEQGGYHHMSSRGNLLFALELSKLMFATSLKN